MNATYAIINLPFLLVSVIVAALAVWRVRSRGEDARAMRSWLTVGGITLLVLVVFTAVFDNVIVGLGIVGYDPALILGAKVLYAPVEDFAYTIAAALLLPSLWVLWDRKHS